MGRAEGDQMTQLFSPARTAVLGVMTGATRHEAPHAVAQQHHFVELDGPRSDQLLQQA